MSNKHTLLCIVGQFGYLKTSNVVPPQKVDIKRDYL